MTNCVYIADKGFFSESNIAELERLNMQYIIPLKRDNKSIQLIISANGNPDYFEAVTTLVDNAPKLKSWKTDAPVPPIGKKVGSVI